MKVFVTGVGGQLGHDVMNELYKRCYEGIGSDVAETYSGVADDSAVTIEEYGLSKAARPFNSRLDKSKLVEAGFKPLPAWQDALSRYLKEIDY